MKRYLILLPLIFIAACASKDGGVVEKDPDQQINEAIEDFIKVTELEPVDRIRTSGQLQHDVITDDYIFVRDRRKTWLIEFVHTCYDIDGQRVEPDIRYDSRELRARFDTIRGCRIRSIYPVTEGMVEEIDALKRPYE